VPALDVCADQPLGSSRGDGAALATAAPRRWLRLFDGRRACTFRGGCRPGGPLRRGHMAIGRPPKVFLEFGPTAFFGASLQAGAPSDCGEREKERSERRPPPVRCDSSATGRGFFLLGPGKGRHCSVGGFGPDQSGMKAIRCRPAPGSAIEVVRRGRPASKVIGVGTGREWAAPAHSSGRGVNKLTAAWVGRKRE